MMLKIIAMALNYWLGNRDASPGVFFQLLVDLFLQVLRETEPPGVAGAEILFLRLPHPADKIAELVIIHGLQSSNPGKDGFTIIGIITPIP